MEFDGLKVVHAGVEQTAADLGGDVDALDARLRALERDLAPLAGAWMGEAREAFVVAKDRWSAAITELRHVLHQTSLQVTLANAEYRSADARGARSFDL